MALLNMVGNMSKGLVRKVVSKIKKESFNKENPTELVSQLIKVLQRDYSDPNAAKVIAELKHVGVQLNKLKK